MKADEFKRIRECIGSTAKAGSQMMGKELSVEQATIFTFSLVFLEALHALTRTQIVTLIRDLAETLGLERYNEIAQNVEDGGTLIVQMEGRTISRLIGVKLASEEEATT